MLSRFEYVCSAVLSPPIRSLVIRIRVKRRDIETSVLLSWSSYQWLMGVVSSKHTVKCLLTLRWMEVIPTLTNRGMLRGIWRYMEIGPRYIPRLLRSECFPHAFSWTEVIYVWIESPQPGNCCVAARGHLVNKRLRSGLCFSSRCSRCLGDDPLYLLLGKRVFNRARSYSCE